MSDQSKPVNPETFEMMPSTSKSISNMNRIQRNVAEKQRRDKLNGYISELASIVPMVSMSSKRLDKTSILRLSAAHLRLSKSPLSSVKKLKKNFQWCPSFLTSDQVRAILESVDGFLIVTSSSGKILFTSSSVERYLGHQNIDMIGYSLFVFIHPEDLDSVKEEMEKLLNASLKCGDSGKSPRCSFRCRMKEKGQPRSEVATYQFVHFAGDMTISNEDLSNKNFKNTAIVTHIFKAFVRVVDPNPYCQLSLKDATADEYVTRHSLDGTIIFADHRISTITGHLPQEVMGQSAYAYIIPEDITLSLFAHHLMFSSDKGTGMIVYRLRTRDDKYVYLKSVGCLQRDRATSEMDHFVCVNQHLSDSEGETQLKYFIERLIPHVQESSVLSLFESIKAYQVTGLKAPGHLGENKGDLCVNKLSTVGDCNIIKSQVLKLNLQYNGTSNFPFLNPSDIPEAVTIAQYLSDSKSNNTSLLNVSPDKNTSSKTHVPFKSKGVQYKNKGLTYSEDVSDNKKKRVLNNNSVQVQASSKAASSNLDAIAVKALPLTELKVAQSNDLSNPKMHQINRFPVSPLPSQDVGIKIKASISENNLKSNYFNKQNKGVQGNNVVNSISVSKNISIQNIKESKQMRISEVPCSSDPENSFQLCNAEIVLPNEVDDSIKNVSMHNINAESCANLSTNVMFSTASISFKNYLKTATSATENPSEVTQSESPLFEKNKVNISDPNQLADINNVVTEANLWPTESSSESCGSNTISEKTFASSLESREDPNSYFMPEEEMKDYFEGPNDISSILNSTLPFDDSSLPSIDGWSECLRPQRVLSTSLNTEVSVQVIGDDPFNNISGEKS